MIDGRGARRTDGNGVGQGCRSCRWQDADEGARPAGAVRIAPGGAFEFARALCYTDAQLITAPRSPIRGKGRIVLAYRYTVVALAVVLVVGLFGCGNSPVAVVDGVKITQSEFEDRMVQVAGQDVLQDMIDRELIKVAAAEADIEVTEEELNEEIERTKSQFPTEEGFNQWLASRDLTLEQWREHVKTIMLSRELALKDVNPSEEELKAFFEENRERYGRPATVSYSEIVVSSREDAREVLQELKSGDASFEDVARRYSLSPTRQRGGEQPEMPYSRINIEPVREAAKALPLGEVSDPIEAEGQWYVIKVRDRKAARDASWEQDRAMVEEHYRATHARELRDILHEQLEKTRVKVLDPRFEALNEYYTPMPDEVPQFGEQGPQSGAPTNTVAPEGTEVPAAEEPTGEGQ